MWAFVTASWWYAMAAWLDRKKDFCLYVANAIDDATPGTQGPTPDELTERYEQISKLGPPDPNREPRAPKVAEELDARYGLTEKGWQEADHRLKRHRK